MRSVLAGPVWGLLPLIDGFAYIKYDKSCEGRMIVSFWLYDFKIKLSKQIPQELYFRYKFGDNFNSVLSQIEPAMSLACQAASDGLDHLLVLFPDSGDFSLFDASSGRLLRQGALLYNDRPITNPVFAGSGWWGICPAKNAVLHFPSDEWLWDFASGGEGKSEFPEPMHLSAYPGRDGGTRLYVCCKGSESIRSLNPDKQYLGIRDFCSLPGYKPLRYFRAAKQHLVLLENGVWAL